MNYPFHKKEYVKLNSLASPLIKKEIHVDEKGLIHEEWEVMECKPIIFNRKKN